MSFYGNLATTAARLIADKGQPITFTRTVSGAFDPATGTVSNTTSNTVLNAAVLPVKQRDDDKFENDTLIQGRVRFLLCEAGDVQVGDAATFQGFQWEVKGSTPINPAGTLVINKLLVTR